jgi:NAD-dependent dihydropyrimidine dehydrogenase PreA subunit
MSDIDYAAIAQAFVPHGLMPRGGFHTLPSDDLDGQTVVMVGHAGPAMFHAFSAARAEVSNPLDHWSRQVIGGVAARFGAVAMHPFERPLRPFQQWGSRAEPLHPSPIGLMIHPEFGLWHGWRGALLFHQRLALPPRSERPSPCDACAAKPCISTCPVDAFQPTGFDAEGCRTHVHGAGVDCRGFGCRARHACPVGRAYAYEPAQAAFHMAAYSRDRPTY